MKYKILNADIYSALNKIVDNSVEVAITSPPYWAQRNYGFDEQIGNEETYMHYISRLVFLFDILKCKLTDKGVFFLNIGDKYLHKYGKTPLGLIPFKLAHFMVKSGWIINDIIIWYKPNHMPSSVKNRFVNSYEPIFVFSKSEENFFDDFKKVSPDFSNVISVNLQPTKFNHIATYPERLVSKLLDMIKIDHDYTVLDPFAGSGTTLKVVLDKNNNLFTSYKMNAIMIEYNSEYVNIIKKRIGHYKIDVQKFPYIDYEYELIKEFWDDFYLENKFLELKTVNISHTREEFYNIISALLSKDFKNYFKKNEIIFIGVINFNISDIYHFSLISNQKWIIRNLIVAKRKKSWFPVFFIVDDNKSVKYLFNYKKLLLHHKSNDITYHHKNFLGCKVIDNLNENKRIGKIYKVISKHPDGLPEYVQVLWDDKEITIEYNISDDDKVDKNILFEDNKDFVKIVEKKEIVPLIKKRQYFETKLIPVNKNREYNGKFKEIERKNWGASPGARSSMENEYFSMQKLYNIRQDLVCDYLNYLRIEAGYSKKTFAELFGDEYKHTVGHWLRKDFGGSIPKIDDWEKLSEYFDLDQGYTNYTCKTALKLQSVRNTKYKIPEDVIDFEDINKLKLLNS